MFWKRLNKGQNFSSQLLVTKAEKKITHYKSSFSVCVCVCERGGGGEAVGLVTTTGYKSKPNFAINTNS